MLSLLCAITSAHETIRVHAKRRPTCRALGRKTTNRVRYTGTDPAPTRGADQAGTLFFLLHASEDHLRAGHVLFRVDEKLVHVLVRPHDCGVLVRLRVGEAVASAGRPAHDAPEGRALLRIASTLDGVALRALCLVQLSALLHVALRNLDVGLWDRHGDRSGGYTLQAAAGDRAR